MQTWLTVRWSHMTFVASQQPNAVALFVLRVLRAKLLIWSKLDAQPAAAEGQTGTKKNNYSTFFCSKTNMQQQPFSIDALYFYALICYFANSRQPVKVIDGTEDLHSCFLSVCAAQSLKIKAQIRVKCFRFYVQGAANHSLRPSHCVLARRHVLRAALAAVCLTFML